MEFEEGKPKWDVCQKKPLDGHAQGTFIVYKPSQEVFSAEPIKFDYNEICEQMKEYSYFNKGITFVVKNAETGEVRKFMSKNGLMDFVKENLDKPIHKTPLHYKTSENGIDVEIILQWTGNREEKFYLFSNGGENENGGTPITGIKTALTNYFKKKLKGTGAPDVLRKGLVYVCSVNLKDPIYDGQTKSRITNRELRGLCQRVTTKMLEDFERRHKDEFDKVVDLLTKELKAEVAAERARKQVLEATKDVERNQKRKVFASDKLKDAEFLGQDSTLLLVEGLSAASSIAMSRDTKRYGILALRGKMINSFSNDEEKFYQNEEVKLLLSAMNIVPGKYNPKKLRYGRIGILTDADADGFAIGLLIMCALYKVAPEFVEEGRLCWMRSPLYIVKKGKKEDYYFTDKEYEDAKLSGKVKGEVQRNKGLGSLSPEQARRSMFTDEFQRLDTLSPDEETLPLLLSLMGRDSEPKRDFIFKNVDFSTIKE
jgi:DNA gyrase subunit B